MLKGKTLRQAARNAATRPDAISWLREQQRVLLLNPQMASLDMRPLWSELGASRIKGSRRIAVRLSFQRAE